MSIFDDIRRDVEAGTPGPWHVGPVDDTRVETGDGECVAEIDGDYNHPDTWPMMEANARRIARVPELERIALAAEELAKVFPDIVGYLEGLIEDGCPKCGGDCSGANPPVSYCPMKSMNNDLARANAAIAKLREATA